MPPLGREVFVVVRGMLSELDARLQERMGDAKIRRLRALLEELGGAVRP